MKFVKIKWIEFENIETGLKVERIDFFNDITLLVGLSGAGKTQILDAIQYSLNLALGKVGVLLCPYKVKLGFVINNHNYEWSYVLKKQPDESEYSFDDINEYYFFYECLTCDGKSIFTRNDESVCMESFSNIPKPKR
ncbi:MAG: AAA family ATPase, partial [Lachnospiraceae bacterium]|nr:AAA family ATPase [Lachnospiraceae bacterium]